MGLNMAKGHKSQPYWQEHVTGGRGKNKRDEIAHPMRTGATSNKTPSLRKPRDKSPQVDGNGLSYITLVQFLKMHDLVATGGLGKQTIRDGGILVNGQEELRPGRKLHNGDKITMKGKEYLVQVH